MRAIERWRLAAVLAAGIFGGTAVAQERDSKLWVALSNHAADCLSQGNTAEATAIYQKVADMAAVNPPPGDTNLAAALNNLGGALRLAGDLVKAEAVLRDAQRHAQETNDELLLGTVLGNLGSVLFEQHEDARAEPVLRRSIAILERTAGANSRFTGVARNNLAAVYRRDGRYTEAEDEMSRALAALEMDLGPAHPTLGAVLNHMFSVLAEEQKWDRAEPYLERAVAIAEAAPPDFRALPFIRMNQGILEEHYGRLQSARQFMEQGIAGEEKVLGSDNPEVAYSLKQYSAVLRQMKQGSQAKKAESRANSILKSFR